MVQRSSMTIGKGYLQLLLGRITLPVRRSSKDDPESQWLRESEMTRLFGNRPEQPGFVPVSCKALGSNPGCFRTDIEIPTKPTAAASGG
jgi:hypothetical protein